MKDCGATDCKKIRFALALTAALLGALTLGSSPALANCNDLPDFDTLDDKLDDVAPSGTAANGGLNNHLWATIVDRDGIVCAVARTGDPGDQWPGSRVISAQKANTANAFSLPGLALSTANLYSAVQPGGSLYGLQHSNPVDTAVAYVGSSATWGTAADDLVGEKVGGVNVFGGGLPLYASDGTLLGGIGVSGDTSCTDHIVAWKVRSLLNLDNVPAGVASGAPDGTDNMIFDITGSHGNFKSKSGFGHPECNFGERPIAEALPTTHPVGP